MPIGIMLNAFWTRPKIPFAFTQGRFIYPNPSGVTSRDSTPALVEKVLDEKIFVKFLLAMEQQQP